MNSKLLLGATPLSASSAMATDLPPICANLANYTAQVVSKRFTDSAQDLYKPRTLPLTSDFKNYPLKSAQYLGNCDEPEPGAPPMKESWCTVAGGVAMVYKVCFETWPGPTSIIVNFNRGGCTVRAVEVGRE